MNKVVTVASFIRDARFDDLAHTVARTECGRTLAVGVFHTFGNLASRVEKGRRLNYVGPDYHIASAVAPGEIPAKRVSRWQKSVEEYWYLNVAEVPEGGHIDNSDNELGTDIVRVTLLPLTESGITHKGSLWHIRNVGLYLYKASDLTKSVPVWIPEKGCEAADFQLLAQWG